MAKSNFWTTTAVSSEKEDWATPPELYKKLNEEFGFTIDLCADEYNHLCDRYYTKENDGLKADIKNEIVYCNPPYGRAETALFVKKCAEDIGGGYICYATSGPHGCTVVS